MSFQEDVRAEMIAHLGERACCDRAALGMAILATGGVSFTGSGSVRLAVQSSRASVVRRFFELAKARYGVLGELRAAKPSGSAAPRAMNCALTQRICWNPWA